MGGPGSGRRRLKQDMTKPCSCPPPRYPREPHMPNCPRVARECKHDTLDCQHDVNCPHFGTPEATVGYGIELWEGRMMGLCEECRQRIGQQFADAPAGEVRE